MSSSVNKLGLKAAGITILAALVLAGLWFGIRAIFSSESDQLEGQDELVSQTLSDQAQEQIVQDTDGDGIPDAVESIYGTDLNNTDSDGDGTIDGDEVVLKRDPAKAGPDDALPPNLQVDLSNSDISLDTYTGRYLAQLPSGAEQNQVLGQEQLEEFVDQARQPLLPDLPQGTVKTNTESGKEAVGKYLDSISASHNPAIASVAYSDIETAFRGQYTDSNTQTLDEITAKLEKNVSILTEVSAPEEVKEVHTKLLQASQSLVNNTKLLKNMPNDFVGGLVGAKNLDELGAVFEGIAGEIAALEEKYQLE